MPRPQSGNFRSPQQIRRFPNGQIETVSHNETTIGRFVMQPGWRWSRDVAPIAGTRTCQVHHVGVVLKGRLHLETDAGEAFEPGTQRESFPGVVAIVGVQLSHLFENRRGSGNDQPGPRNWTAVEGDYWRD